jgi:hypothetical protein
MSCFFPGHLPQSLYYNNFKKEIKLNSKNITLKRYIIFVTYTKIHVRPIKHCYIFIFVISVYYLKKIKEKRERKLKHKGIDGHSENHLRGWW